MPERIFLVNLCSYSTTSAIYLGLRVSNEVLELRIGCMTRVRVDVSL